MRDALTTTVSLRFGIVWCFVGCAQVISRADILCEESFVLPNSNGWLVDEVVVVYFVCIHQPMLRNALHTREIWSDRTTQIREEMRDAIIMCEARYQLLYEKDSFV